MTILLTGASGFLGRIINKNFKDSIITLGRKNCDIISDIANNIPPLPKVEIVIHAAGKAHTVPKNQKEAKQFFDINVKGTHNLLKALEQGAIPKSFVFISSVAVYGVETGRLINESSQLLATDPYGKSKIEAERLVTEWANKNGVICTILRLPLIAGINPPGNLKSMIDGIKKGYYFNIDGGRAKKSIVLAEDVAKIIPVAAKIGGIYNLTDSYHPAFFELSRIIAGQLNKPIPLNIPKFFATFIAKIGDFMGDGFPINSKKIKKITSDLTFDDSKAKRLLDWQPMSVLEGFKINL